MPTSAKRLPVAPPITSDNSQAKQSKKLKKKDKKEKEREKGKEQENKSNAVVSVCDANGFERCAETSSGVHYCDESCRQSALLQQGHVAEGYDDGVYEVLPNCDGEAVGHVEIARVEGQFSSDQKRHSGGTAGGKPLTMAGKTEPLTRVASVGLRVPSLRL
jgi:hypothetical protein